MYLYFLRENQKAVGGDASAIGMLIERTTLFIILAKMDHATADATVTGLGTVLNLINAQWSLSVNYHQGC